MTTSVHVDAHSFDLGVLRRLLNVFEGEGAVHDLPAAQCFREALYEALERSRQPRPLALLEEAVAQRGSIDEETVRAVEAQGSTVAREARDVLCARLSRTYRTPHSERGYRAALAARRVRPSPDATLPGLRAMHVEHHAPCPVCHRAIVPGDACMSLGCGHLTHTVCMKTRGVDGNRLQCARCRRAVPLDGATFCKLLKCRKP